MKAICCSAVTALVASMLLNMALLSGYLEKGRDDYLTTLQNKISTKGEGNGKS